MQDMTVYSFIRNRNCLHFKNTSIHSRLFIFYGGFGFLGGGVGSMLLKFLIWLSCLFLFFFVADLCLMLIVAHVSLDCSFLIVPSVFSSVYIYHWFYNEVLLQECIYKDNINGYLKTTREKRIHGLFQFSYDKSSSLNFESERYQLTFQCFKVFLHIAFLIWLLSFSNLCNVK